MKNVKEGEVKRHRFSRKNRETGVMRHETALALPSTAVEFQFCHFLVA